MLRTYCIFSCDVRDEHELPANVFLNSNALQPISTQMRINWGQKDRIAQYGRADIIEGQALIETRHFHDLKAKYIDSLPKKAMEKKVGA